MSGRTRSATSPVKSPTKGKVTKRRVIITSPAKTVASETTEAPPTRRIRAAKEAPTTPVTTRRSAARKAVKEKEKVQEVEEVAPKTPSPVKTPRKSPVRTPLPPLRSPLSPPTPVPRTGELTRAQLQTIAKRIGLKANQSTNSLVAQIDTLVNMGEIAKHNVEKRQHYGTGRDLYEAQERRGKKRSLSFSITAAPESPKKTLLTAKEAEQKLEKRAPPKKKRRVTLH